MDESGHSGDTGPADSENSSDARERVRVNGWVTSDSPWSPPPNSEDDASSWRRPTGESRLFPRSQTFPTSAQPASAVPAPPPPGFIDAQRDATRDAQRDATRDAPRDVSRDAYREAPRDGQRDTLRDTQQDGLNDAMNDARNTEPTGDQGEQVAERWPETRP